METMETIRSADSTHIAYERTGEGPPLVLVHGTSADHGRWAPILPALATRRTVYALDRRGRGASGDGVRGYQIEDEFADVATVVGAAAAGGQQINLFGHSYGALCALEAALRTPHLKRLILYEPLIPQGGPMTPPALLAQLETLLAAGDREGVVETFLREGAMVPPHEIARMKTLPAWRGRVAAAHTIPRELAAVDGYRYDAARFCALAVPTVLLLGGESPAFYKSAAEALRGALPNGRIAVLPGQRHVAMDAAPELFLREVASFLDEA